MKRNTAYFKVGLFVLLCAVGLIGGLLFVGADVLRGEVVRVETYIDESVQGLTVGSAVLYRGVNIGRVERITFVQAEYPMQPQSPEYERFSSYVMVVMALDPRRFPDLDRDPDLITALLRNQVSIGLRFKLSYQGITGLSFIEADYVKPELHPELQVPWIPKNIYISSTRSLFTSFTQAIESVFENLNSVFERLDKIQFEELSNQFIATLTEIQTMVRDADVAEIRSAMIALMDDFKETNRHIQNLLAETDEPVPGNIRTAIQEFSKTVAHIDELLARHETDVDVLMANLKILSQNLRQVSDSLKDNPARAFFAAPPEKSELVQ